MRPLLVIAAALVAAVTVAGPGAAAPTAPPVGGVAVIGDFGTGDSAERSVANLVSRARPAAVVTVGDNVYDSDDYATLVGDYYGRWVRSELLFPATGNHDYAEGIEAFDDYFRYLKGLRVYTRVVDGIQFYVLDSQAALDSATDLRRQQAWLRWAMPRSKARWQVVVLHHPPFSSGAAHGSTTAMQWPFARWGADLVLSGHDHTYERVAAAGTTYVVAGTGGRDLYEFADAVPGSTVRFADDVGALFLATDGGRLTGEFWTVGGRLVDRFAVRG